MATGKERPETLEIPHVYIAPANEWHFSPRLRVILALIRRHAAHIDAMQAGSVILSCNETGVQLKLDGLIDRQSITMP